MLTGGLGGRSASSSSNEEVDEQRVGECELEWRVRRSLRKLDVPKAVRKAAAARGENVPPVAAPFSAAPAFENGGAPASATASFVRQSSGANATAHRSSTRSLVFRSYTNFATIPGFGYGTGPSEAATEDGAGGGLGAERHRQYKVTLPSAKLRDSTVRLGPIESKLPSSFEEFRRSMPNLAVLEAGQKRAKRAEAAQQTPAEKSSPMIVRLTPDDFKRTSARFLASGTSTPTIGAPSPGFNESPVRSSATTHHLRALDTELIRAEVQAALDSAPPQPPLIPAPPNESLVSEETASTSDRSSNRLDLPATASFARSTADWHHVVKLLRRKTMLHKRLFDQSERRAVQAFQLLAHLTGVPSLDAQLSYLDRIDTSRRVRVSSDERLVFLCETLLNELASKAAVCEVLGRYAQMSAAVFGQGAVLLTLHDVEEAQEFYAKLLRYPTGFSALPSPVSYTNGTSSTPNGTGASPAPSPGAAAIDNAPPPPVQWPVLSYVPVKDLRQSLVLGCGATVRTLADLTCLYNADTHLILAVLLFAADAPPPENVLQLSVKWLCVPILSAQMQPPNANANGLSSLAYTRVAPAVPPESSDRLSRSLPFPKEKQPTPPRVMATLTFTIAKPNNMDAEESVSEAAGPVTNAGQSAAALPKSATLPTREPHQHKEHGDGERQQREKLVQQLQRLVRSHQLSLKLHFGELYELARDFVNNGTAFERRVVRFVSPVDRAEYELTFSVDAQPTLTVVPPPTGPAASTATASKRVSVGPSAHPSASTSNSSANAEGTSGAAGVGDAAGAREENAQKQKQRQSREVRVDRELQMVIAAEAQSKPEAQAPHKPDRSTAPAPAPPAAQAPAPVRAPAASPAPAPQQQHVTHVQVLLTRPIIPEAALAGGEEPKLSATLDVRYFIQQCYN